MSQQVSAFNLPHEDFDTPMRRILNSAFSSVGIQPTQLHNNIVFWDTHYLELDKVQLFMEANTSEKQQILQIANRDLLEEIYWVEQAGVGYMAKMLLLSETCEERLLYSLFTTDEATHLAQICPFLGEEPQFRGDSFLQFMAQVIESSDKALLMSLVQVVLEGWGLSHYRSLAKNCLNDSLKSILQGFLQAESRHHAAGVTQLQQWEYSSQSLDNIHTALSTFLHMVQIGPQRLLTAIAQGKGYLSRVDQIQILEDLKTEIHSDRRLKLLRSLMLSSIPNSIIQKLEDQGSFKPYPAQLCVL